MCIMTKAKNVATKTKNSPENKVYKKVNPPRCLNLDHIGFNFQISSLFALKNICFYTTKHVLAIKW